MWVIQQLIRVTDFHTLISSSNIRNKGVLGDLELQTWS